MAQVRNKSDILLTLVFLLALPVSLKAFLDFSGLSSQAYFPRHWVVPVGEQPGGRQPRVPPQRQEPYPGQIGSSCEQDSDCYTGNCLGNVCGSIGERSPMAGSCGEDTDCGSGNCVAGRCQGVGQMSQLGGPCSLNNDCFTGSCIGGTCSWQGSEGGSGVGGSCEYDTDCLSGNCAGDLGTCVAATTD